MSDKPLRAPFPWFGGKSRAASLMFHNGNPTPPAMDVEYFERCAKMLAEAKAERERDHLFSLFHPKPLHELRLGNLYQGEEP